MLSVKPPQVSNDAVEEVLFVLDWIIEEGPHPTVIDRMAFSADEMWLLFVWCGEQAALEMAGTVYDMEELHGCWIYKRFSKFVEELVEQGLVSNRGDMHRNLLGVERMLQPKKLSEDAVTHHSHAVFNREQLRKVSK